jgi:hypothetical protein
VDSTVLKTSQRRVFVIHENDKTCIIYLTGVSGTNNDSERAYSKRNLERQ